MAWISLADPTLIIPFVGQLDNTTFLLLLCCLVAMIPSLFGGGQSDARPTTETDTWYTTQKIAETYEAIEQETAEWRKKAEETAARDSSAVTRLRRAFSRGRREGRYVVQEGVPPKLFKLKDDVVGPIYFELTEVEGGGTVVKTTYSSQIKDRIATFKTRLPLKIPAVPLGDKCPACGKSVLRDFLLCPYCGQQLVRE